jgi:predicted amidophosphoribosyltransferase
MLLDRLLHVLAPPLCAHCGAHAGSAEPLCARCRQELRWLGPAPAEVRGVAMWAPLAYEGPAQGVVRALKFKGARRAARAMAAQIVANAPPGWLDGGSGTLVPAPLHPKRARTRGYNQALLLAEAIAGRTGHTVADCLERTGSARTQMGRDRARRLTGVAGSVRLRTAPPPAGALLVDDVITTGATLVACAEALGGAKAIAYARTSGR